MAGEGHRVMAAAVRDLDPAAFDPEGDLLGYVTDLQMASLVAMVDPPREESKAAVRDAQRAHIRVRMVTGDDVTTGAAIAKQLGIPGDGDARGRSSPRSASRSACGASTTSASSAASRPSTRCSSSRRSARRATWSP